MCRVSTGLLEKVPDHLQWKEVLALLTENPHEPVQIILGEAAIARCRPFGADQALGLQIPDFRNGHIRKLGLETGEDLADSDTGLLWGVLNGHDGRDPQVAVPWKNTSLKRPI
ncbi:MAG: hypothetical protein MAG471_00227 [Acidimicrobiaceae bacterium]|nr:hypothetical protein [Acidimicrobiaceae bacterium]